MADVSGPYERLTADFRRAEFACQCGCGFDSISLQLVIELQRLRLRLGRAITVLSGCRCAKHNAAVGGAAGSQHMLGLAADIQAHGLGPRDIYEVAVAMAACRIGGIGVDDERGFIHLDTRKNSVVPFVRWCYKDGREVAWHEAAK
jgi:uncharacterized protein YcbK (DUF882 family)